MAALKICISFPIAIAHPHEDRYGFRTSAREYSLKDLPARAIVPLRPARPLLDIVQRPLNTSAISL